MTQPASTAWQERIAPGEDQAYERAADTLTAIQAQRSAKYGPGRGLHRKQLLAAQGTLTVRSGLPAFAAHGLFAQAAEWPVWVRVSNGGMDRAPDKMPDIRGFALRVQGVSGESALGGETATHQDFLFINQEVFAFPQSAEFVDFVAAASKGNGALLRHLIARYGVLGGLGRLKRLLATVGKKFAGYAHEPLFTAAPQACGPYAIKLRLVPAGDHGPADPQAAKDWGEDLARRLRGGTTLHWELQVQPFVDEKTTPIEDASVAWASPFVTVADLTLPPQDVSSPEGKAFADRVEKSVFDPWQALAAHRPLGDVQRARKVVYYRSQQNRQAQG